MPRRRFGPRRVGTPVGQIDAPILVRATILDNGMIGDKPKNKTQLERHRSFPSPAEAENDLYALNTLQLRRDFPLEQLTVQIPIEYLYDNLPPGARSLIGLPMCGSRYVFNCSDQYVDRRIHKMYNKWPSFWEFFRNFEYVFWPIETDRGYFVTAIFHMEKGMMDDPNVDPDEDLEVDIPQVPDPRFGIVDAWSVIDPERGQAAQDRINQVRDRIQRIFTAEGIVFKVQSYKDQEVVGGVRRSCPWVPPPPNPEESWSSGVRAFDLIRQLMQRVLNMYCNQRGYSEAFFTEPTCGWINVDQVRYEMMSMCAINTLDDMNWNARLAVEGIREITTLDPEFRTTLLAPDDADKHAYVPASDIAGPITVLP